MRDRLFDDEELLIVARPGRLVAIPKYVMTLGAYGIWRKRNAAAVTDRRVLLGKGVIRRNETSIPLDQVDDVSVTRRGIQSYAELIIKRGDRTALTRVGPLPHRSARRFATYVLQRH